MFKNYFAKPYSTRFFSESPSVRQVNKPNISSVNRVRPIAEVSRLTHLYQQNEYDRIGELSGIKIIERRNYIEDKTTKKDCIWYVTQKLDAKIVGEYSFSAWQPKNYVRVRESHVGAPVIYHLYHISSWENHIGIYSGNGLLQSKFGYGHVYEHSIDLVPEDYGPFYSFYRPALTQDKATTIENMETWFQNYGSILSIQVDFPSYSYSGVEQKMIHQALEQTRCFFRKSYGREVVDEQLIEYSIYEVYNDFLNNEQHREALRQLYYEHGQKNEFPTLLSLRQSPKV